jgi:hypothetical protein
MHDPHTAPAAIHELDRAVHPNRGDEISRVHAHRRVPHGQDADKRSTSRSEGRLVSFSEGELLVGTAHDAGTPGPMKRLCIALLTTAVVAVALPAPANAARFKNCEGIGDTITKLRAKGLPCDTARTLSAKWAETAAAGGGRVVRIDGFRCVRSNPPGPGRAARCGKQNGAVVVKFRYRLP